MSGALLGAIEVQNYTEHVAYGCAHEEGLCSQGFVLVSL